MAHKGLASVPSRDELAEIVLEDGTIGHLNRLMDIQDPAGDWYSRTETMRDRESKASPYRYVGSETKH